MNAFDEAYFMHGVTQGRSNFENYRWLPDASISWATHLMKFLGIKEGDTVLDVGAARGFYCQALRMLGVQAFGYDISEWAVANCHPEMKPYMSNYLNGQRFDYVISKDCAEHIEPEELKSLVKRLMLFTNRKLFFIVPLAFKTGGGYIHEKEEHDSTHINRWTLHDWLTFFQNCSPAFIVNGSYRYPGLKPGAYEVENGYGFFTLDRI